VKEVALLKNVVQEYAWGCAQAIPTLLGKPPACRPQAELWMGAHPKAPSLAHCNEEWLSLDTIIAADPAGVLGNKVAGRFNNTLPFLFKVLAAAKPLSIQAHPDKAQAQAGFDRENMLGIAPDAPQRNYKDSSHKPEIICALTPFWALCGFRPLEEAKKEADHGQLRKLGSLMSRRQETAREEECLADFFQALLRLPARARKEIIAEVVSYARDHGKSDVFRWVLRLHQEYPGDIGALAPIFLNVIRLEPMQALFLPAGRLHAYLEGVGIELMANSDNVLRGGLTRKHVDAAELLNVLSFSAERPQILSGREASPGAWIYSAPAEEFLLTRIELKKDRPYVGAGDRSCEIILCIEGEGAVEAAHGACRLDFNQGTSMIVPAAAGAYTLSGEGRLFKAGVPY